jgi:hypothetical protein
MEHVIVMGIAIIQLDYAFAMVTLREMIVHVSNNTFSPCRGAGGCNGNPGLLNVN